VAEYSNQISQTPTTSYLTTDNLGSPRIITNQAGAIIARHDYAAFGEEIATPQRTSGISYVADNIRFDYTGYQKDDKSGLEFAQARYFNPKHGRFTSVDPLTASATIKNPQTFNRYSYGLNSPYKFTDPLGLASVSQGSPCGQFCSNTGYKDLSGSGIRGVDTTFESLLDIYWQREYRTYTVIQSETDGRQATVTVNSTVDRKINRRTGRAVDILPPVVSVSATNTGSANFSDADLSIMEDVSRDLVYVALERGIDPRLVLAMAQRESHLGVGARRDPGNNDKPEMDPRVNPLQLDGNANGKYFAHPVYRKNNIRLSLQLFYENYPRSKDLEERLGHYNDGGVIGAKGKSYAADVISKRDAIKEKIGVINGPTVIPGMAPLFPY
jgi:RHS repeat-associated protein